MSAGLGRSWRIDEMRGTVGRLTGGRAMSGDLEGLARRLEDVSHRLERVERHLGLSAGQARGGEAAGVAKPAAATPVASVPPLVTEATVGATAGPMAAPAVPPMTPPMIPPMGPPGTPPMTPPAGPRVSPRAAVAKVRSGVTAESLEKWIGTRWYAALGALAVVVGTVLFVKLAYDEGWLRVAPMWRCVFGGLGGAVLLGVGELVRRRVGAVASAGIFAAGLGGMYASAYAAYQLYGLVPAAGAFAMLAMVSVLGVLIGALTRQAFVGVLALVSGYLTPLLLSQGEPSFVVLPLYLLLLLATGQVLAAWLAGRFAVLRSVAWWGTIALGGVWVLNSASEAPVNVILFAALAWAMVHAELWYSTSRGRLAPAVRGGVDAPVGLVGEAGPRSPERRGLPWPLATALIGSFTTTAWATGCAVQGLGEMTLVPEWIGPAGWAVAGLMVSLVLAGNLRPLLDKPTTQAEFLGVGMATQAVGLVFVALAMGLAGLGQVVAWLALAAAGLAAGWWGRARAFEIYGWISLIIGTARLVVYDSWASGLNSGGLVVLVPSVTTFTVLVGIAGVLWILAAASLLRWGSAGATVAARLFLAPATACVLLMAATPENDAAAAALLWAVLAGVMVVASRWVVPLGLEFAALVVSLCAGLAWATLSERWNASGAVPLLQPWLWLGVLVAGAFVLCGVGSPGRGRSRGTTALWIGGSLGLVMVFAATSLEVARVAARLADDATAQAAAVSIWWGVFACGMIVAGFVSRLAPVRHVGLAMLGIAAVKTVVVDLSDVPAVWRIASFIGLGVLMLAVAVLYGKVSARLGSARGEASGAEASEGTQT